MGKKVAEGSMSFWSELRTYQLTQGRQAADDGGGVLTSLSNA